MLWDIKLSYHSSSIQEMKHVLTPNSCFLKFEAGNTVSLKINDMGNRHKPMIKNITKTPLKLWSDMKFIYFNTDL